MRRTAIGAAAVAAAVVGSALPVGATAAQADHPNTVCSHWSPAGENSHHVQVDWMAGRSFRVSITDFTLHAAEREAGDSFVKLPLDPNLRLSTNTVSVGDGLTVSDVSISQGVAVGGAGDDHAPIDNYRKLPSAPWESATVSGSTITWLHDVDALSDADGTQIHPSDSPTAARAADSAGVLDFTVTVPDSVGGDVPLIAGMTSEVTAGVLSTETTEWTPGQVLARAVQGCTVSVEPVGSPDEKPASTPEDGDQGQQPHSPNTPDRGSEKQSRDQEGQPKTPKPRTDPDPQDAREPTGPGHTAPGNTSTRSPDDPAPTRGSGTSEAADVASTGGFNPTPWIVGAGATAALGIALAVAARRSTRAKRGQPDNTE
ncbi:hypothetical protein [Leucobacter sp. G161]|uniref:hypothetical protein n=1 Tax=Leucobacter sp. G161 TaxID=663704 RepID=UPI00073B2A6B|nr:hypothetical protein [Leucobacter sp. G161]KUF06763.1 hypothetical protein AUL38_10920 [Leucobacter sp. G161]